MGSMTEFLSSSTLFGSNAPFIEELYDRYLADPASIDGEWRGYFVVIAFVVSAIITPPDVVSQLALAIPMCLLYEMGLWAARIFIKTTQAPPEDTGTHSRLG